MNNCLRTAGLWFLQAATCLGATAASTDSTYEMVVTADRSVTVGQGKDVCHSLPEAFAALHGKTGTDTCYIRVQPGDYFVDRPLVIDPSVTAPVVVTGEGSTKPRLLGGLRVSGWEPCGDRLWRAYIPEVQRYGLTFEQFYVNGERKQLARTPNEGWRFVQKAVETPFEKGTRAADYAVQRVSLAHEDMELLRHLKTTEAKEVKLRFYHKWDITQKHCDYVSRDSDFVYIRGTGMKPWNPLGENTRYIVSNCKTALDMPGEWYLDRREGYLYYLPTADEDLRTAECIVPTIRQHIVLRGEPDRPVKDITFRNLSFQYTSYNMPAEGNEPMQAAAAIEAAVEADFTENVVFDDCEFQHLGAYAIWLRRECRNNVLHHNYLSDMGAGGIKVGEPYLRDNHRPITQGNRIDNNILTGGGYELPCGVGIGMFFTSDNEVTHNEISNFRYSGVSIGWMWGYNSNEPAWTNGVDERGEATSLLVERVNPAVRNRVLYNHIHHIGWGELSDMGAVYTLGESPGTIVSHNVIHDVYSYDYGGWGLYTDEGSTHVEMSYNLAYRCKNGGFHQHYGKENRIVNNILALGTNNQLQCTRAEKHRSFTFRHNIVLTQGEELMRGSWEQADIDADKNCYWSLNGPLNFCKKDFPEWKRTKERHSVMEDPGLADPLNGDFRLTRKSTARKIGFQEFRPEEAGVYGDAAWKQQAQLPDEVHQAFVNACAKWAK